MTKKSAWHHDPDTDDTDWQEICDRNCIHYNEPIPLWEIVRECLCALFCFVFAAAICIAVILIAP